MAQVRVPARDVVLFARQLAVLFRAGVPLNVALESLAQQAEDPTLGEVLWTLSDSITSGHMLSGAMAAFPRVFPPVFVRMIRVGESTGDLHGCLAQLADWLERDQRVAHKVRAALSYPAFVAVLGIVLTLLIFSTVLPPFFGMLAGMHIQLPWSTRLMMLLTELLRQPGCWLCLISGGALAVSWARERLARPQQAAAVWRVLVRVPGLGRLLVLSSLARYLSAAYALLTSGVDVLLAWRLAAESSGNPLLAEDGPRLTEHLRAGGTVSSHMLAHAGLYTRTLAQVVRAGEETATAVSLLPRLQSLFEQEVEAALEALAVMLEPLLLLGVASVMGFSMVSAFLPLYSYLARL